MPGGVTEQPRQVNKLLQFTVRGGREGATHSGSEAAEVKQAGDEMRDREELPALHLPPVCELKRSGAAAAAAAALRGASRCQ